MQVRQLEEGIKLAAVVARELGIRRNQLYKWKNEITDKGPDAAFKGPGADSVVLQIVVRRRL